MADVTRNINVKVNADSTDAVAALGAVDKALERQKTSFDNLRRSLDPAYSGAEKFRQVQIQVADAVKSGATSQTVANKVLQEAARRYTGAIPAAEKLAAEQERLAETSRNIKDAFDRARSSVDGLYASSKAYEQVERQVNAAVSAGQATQSEANRVLELAKQKYLMTGQAAQQMGHQIRTAQAHTTNLIFQFQDIGMMLAAGQNPLMLAMQQGTQVAGVFHQMKGAGLSAFAGIKAGLSALVSPMALVTVGAIAGGAALVQWAAGAFGADSEAKSLKETLDELSSATSEMKAANDLLSGSLDTIAQKYGTVNPQILEHIRLMREDAAASLERVASGTVNSLIDEYSGFFSTLRMSMQDLFNMNVGQANKLATALEDVRDAADLSDRLAAAQDYRDQILAIKASSSDWNDEQQVALEQANKIVDALMQAKVQADKLASTSISGPISAAANEASRLSGNLANAVANFNALSRAQAGLGQGGRGGGMEEWRRRQRDQMGGAQGIIAGTDTPMGEAVSEILNPSKGGGGGGDTRNFDALIESLQTQTEIIDTWYAESLVRLNEATDAELALIGGKNEAKLRLEEEYQKRLAAIRDAEKYATLQGYGDMFGALSQVFQAGGEKNLGIAKAFGAAQAAVSMWVGAAKALELPFPQNLAAWAKVLATGAQAIQGIKNVSSGGNTGRGATSASATAPEPTRTANINISGDVIGKQTGQQLVTTINEAMKAGYRLNLEWN